MENREAKRIENYKICDTYLSKAFGLMFSRKRNLIFIFDKERQVSLHMLFVFFSLTAIYLNENKEVVYTKKLFPFISICNPKEKAKYILELIDNTDIKIGDKINW